MTLRERIEQLEPRERMLLNVFAGVVVVFVVLLLPILLYSMLSGQRAHNRQLEEAIDSIHQSRTLLAKREAEKAKVLARYERRAPALAGFVETHAKKQDLDIPESQPRPAVPHGKDYDERGERFTLRRVDLMSLVEFMEGITQSGYPVTISELNIRKRSTDSYDVTMVVSAFDRKAEPQEADADAEAAEPGDDEEDEP